MGPHTLVSLKAPWDAKGSPVLGYSKPYTNQGKSYSLLKLINNAERER